MNLAVCILFFEKAAQTIECVRSFIPSGMPVVVLNNGSSATSREAFVRWARDFPQVRLLDAPTNLGVSGGRNHLIDNTSEEWLLFVDNDIVINTPDWTQRVAAASRQHGDAEVLVPQLLNLHEGRYVAYRELDLAGETVTFGRTATSTLNHFPGGASVVRRSLFERLGGYDASMFVGGEDFELALRGLTAGAPVRAVLLEDVELVHDHRRVSRSRDAAAIAQRYDIDRIAQSFETIRRKHGVVVDDDWRAWVVNQRRQQLPARGWLARFKALLTGVANREAAADALQAIPVSCTLYMSSKCNLACEGCRRSLVAQPGEAEMTLATVNRLLASYPGLQQFCVAGFGEPTLCPEFVPIIDALTARRATVGIITNGLDSEKLLALQREPAYISISLYGHDPESYRNYCGAAVFETVLDNYRRLKERFSQVGFSYILGRHNVRELPQVMTLIKSLQPAFVNLVNYLPYDEPMRDRVITCEDRDILEFIAAEVADAGELVRMLPCPIVPGGHGTACRSYERVLNLDGAGNIGGCQRQVPPDMSFGNIFTDTDPFNSTRMKAQRFRARSNGQAHTECASCFGAWLSD